jgi:hypothetical protein
MMGDKIFDLGVENEALGDKLSQGDEKRLTESKNRNKLSYFDTNEKQFILQWNLKGCPIPICTKF